MTFRRELILPKPAATVRVSSRLIGIMIGGVALLGLVSPREAIAVSNFSRQFKMGCTACHSTTPRLNHFGEKLMLRGNELDRMKANDVPKAHVDIPAGISCTSCHNDGSRLDEAGGAQLSRNLFLHKVSNLLGLRFKHTVASVESKKLTEGGKKKSRLTVGKTDWIQFWVAGPIAKDITIRAEAELADGKAVGLHNYAIAFSNLFDTPEGVLNFRTGGFTHGEWLSISDQKRAFAPHFSIYEFKSAKGTGEDTFKVAGAEPAVELYGYTGPLVYQVGASNGKSSTDVNSDLDYWSTLKHYLATRGAFAGSSLSASYVTGTDSKNSALPTIQKDKFHRYIASGGLRYRRIDAAGSYIVGKDDNWDLATDLKNKFHGGFAQVLYTATDKVTPGLIYQRTLSDDKSLNKHALLLGINYYVRQNLFWSTYYDRDLRSTSSAYPDRQNSFAVQFRGMF